MEKYKCKECGCQEFISQLNKYDIYKVKDNKIVLTNSVLIDDKLVLYCRDCSQELEFKEEDVII